MCGLRYHVCVPANLQIIVVERHVFAVSMSHMCDIRCHTCVGQKYTSLALIITTCVSQKEHINVFLLR